MSERAWHRSLYWRIAVGFVVFLAVTLAIQVGVFVLIAMRADRAMAPEAMIELSRLVAADVGTALERDPHVDLDRYLEERYRGLRTPVFVVSRDGHVSGRTFGPPPPPAVRTAMIRLRRGVPAGLETGGPGRPPETGGLPRPPDTGAPPRPPEDEGVAHSHRPAAFAPVTIRGQSVAMVVVLPGRPFAFVFGEFGLWLALAAIGLVVVGSAAAAFLSFGPAHRRLRGLAEAARRLGSGELGARAPDAGGDEIAAVARTFNRMAADLAARAGELESLDRARRQLLADVSHELMTPLTAIRGYVETLSMPEAVPDEAARARCLAIVGEETHRLERIVGDLLDLARTEAGGGEFRVVEFPVADLFERVLARHRREADARGVRLEPAVGEGAETLRGDPERLEQALQNLAANAVRHTPRGGLVVVRSLARDGQVVLEVADTGEGIPPEHLPFVFDRFYKADAARTGRSAGSGLGLSVVKAIVERHGGTVSASSRPGVETVFAIAIPAGVPPGTGGVR